MLRLETIRSHAFYRAERTQLVTLTQPDPA